MDPNLACMWWSIRPGTDSLEFVASVLSGSAGEQKGPNGDGRYEILGLPPGDYHVAIERHHPAISADNFGGIFQTLYEERFEKEYYNNAFVQDNAQIIRVEVDRVIENIDFAIGPSAPGAPFIRETIFSSQYARSQWPLSLFGKGDR